MNCLSTRFARSCLNQLRGMIYLIFLAGSSAAMAQSHHQPAIDTEQDPFAPVFIVTSKNTFEEIRKFARDGVERRDSLGTPLVVAQVQAYQLSDISHRIHERELRCGGFFAFASRAEADAFIRADRAADSVSRAVLVDYTIDNSATVNPWLPAVTESRIRDTLTSLTSYRNRYYNSTYGRTSAEWIRTTWANLAAGRTDVTAELFTACSNCSTQPSVILTIQGTDLASEVIVLGAHLDSINGSAGGSSEQLAPGADDDGSGIATLTEVIRISLASGWKPKRTVKFMGYAAEEVGLRGSNAIAQSFKNSGINVVGVMQFDMTNYKSGNVEDMQLITDYSNAALKTFVTNLFDHYLAPMGLTRSTYTCGYGCSDHASWTSAGFPAAMMFEAGDSGGGYFPYIHTANDTLANMGNSAQNSVKFAQLGLAFLGELGKTKSTTPGNQPPVANFSFSFSGLSGTFTDSSTDSDGTIASRSWAFGDGTTSTATHPSKTYASAGTYSVTLTVTDNQGATHSKTQSVTVTDSSGNVLSNGVPKTGISGAVNATQVFTLVVPAGATNLRFVTSGGTGDADLYVKFGSAPTTSSYDCKSTGSANAETCAISSAQAGTYYVMVHAYSAFSGMSLTGSYSTGGGNVLQNGVPVSGLTATSGNSLSYTLVVPAGATNLRFTTSGGTGDADLYVRFGSPPTTSTYTCRSWASGNTETCAIANAQAGTYHVMVRAYATFSGATLTGSFTP
ncbi:M20/M25/M40 family metallo-hydrolase [Tahibacter amnicola]|uniref:M20/M25/M40 family metallo-hydrolase n=1 Tax=Tahibacter amnicola TaxID=2976241 RepID=A0ABY6BKP8_9GAMM|nr:M20/M25/M40 family metallo-hydrolase [Tahibacter amnicola]UXI70469.1 M20/M25/M40 family metallo-hydrolase [Tahibacter amnicola]